MSIHARAWLTMLLLIAPAASEAGERLRYTVYAAGFNILLLEATTEIGETNYRVDLTYRTAGLLGTFFPSSNESFAQGSWGAAGPEPWRFATWGTVRGNVRRAVIDYVSRQPVTRELVPALEDDREPVPPGMERDSVDTLSGLAFVVREVARTGKCDGRARLFDGRRVMDVVARPAGQEVLAPDSRSSFAGPAVRCDFEGRQLAGFLKDYDAADRQKLHLNRAWFAPIGASRTVVPVRIEFEARLIGHATAYLSPP
ncbi:MAG: DUF3108 domain-containing protein [Alphaproteobacteria bacterium]|nr:DUF3108 domain-containing protein [Alphaproteobacteria bacterium]